MQSLEHCYTAQKPCVIFEHIYIIHYAKILTHNLEDKSWPASI